jgi:hypothetical protein
MNTLKVIKDLLEMDHTLVIVFNAIELLCGLRLNIYYKILVLLSLILFLNSLNLTINDRYIVLSFIISSLTFKEKYTNMFNKLNCYRN